MLVRLLVSVSRRPLAGVLDYHVVRNPCGLGPVIHSSTFFLKICWYQLLAFSEHFFKNPQGSCQDHMIMLPTCLSIVGTILAKTVGVLRSNISH